MILFQSECESLHVSDDEEAVRLLENLKKYAVEELELLPSIREKLCFLVSSLPVPEICTPHVQVRLPPNCLLQLPHVLYFR